MTDVPLNKQSITTNPAGSTPWTSAPAQGAVETWPVAALGAGIRALAAGEYYKLVDNTTGASDTQQSEVITVVGPVTAGATSLGVIRGTGGSSTAVHAATSTFAIIVDAYTLGATAALAVPAYAGARTRPFDPTTSLYNVTPSSMMPIRAAVAKAQTDRVAINFWGHSIPAGAFATIGVDDMASQLRRVMLGEGANISGSGYVQVTNNVGPGANDDVRWTTQTFTISGDSRYPWAYSTLSGKQAIMQSDMPGTIVEYPQIIGNGYGPVALYIDDVLAETFDPAAGTPSVVVRQITGLRNTNHKVELRSTTADAQGTTIFGVRVRQVSGFEVSNMAMGGSTSTAWLPSGALGENWSVANVISTNDIVILGIDGNDMVTGMSLATSKANMQAIIAALIAAGKAVVLLTMPPGKTADAGGAYPNFTQARAEAWQSMEYDLADQYNIPLLDMTHLLVSYSELFARGWSEDDLHPSAEAQSLAARVMAQSLFKSQPYDSKADPLETEWLDGATPPPPASGVKTFSRRRGRTMLSFIDSDGLDVQVQESLASGRINRFLAQAGSATLLAPEGQSLTVVSAGGSAATAVSPTYPGTFFTRRHRARVLSTAVAGTAGSLRTNLALWALSSTPNEGGFAAVFRFGLNAVAATNRVFVGFSTTTAALAAGTDPSALLNLIGVGCDAADAGLSIMHNDGSGAATKIPLTAATFPVTTSPATYFYELTLYASSGGGQKFRWAVRRLNDNKLEEGVVVSTNMPAVDTALAAHLTHGNGTSGTQVSLDFQQLTIGTDN